MDYQAERLGLIVDLAEQSMDIVQRFSNDPIGAGNIQTASGPIKNLKQVSADIKSDGEAAVDEALTELMDTLKADTSVSALIDGLTDAAALAAESATRAELAADSANATGKIYDSTAIGLLPENTVSGQYFSVPSGDPNGYLILYKNNAGVPVEIGRFASAAAVEKVLSMLRSFEGTAIYNLLDELGFLWGEVNSDGFNLPGLVVKSVGSKGLQLFGEEDFLIMEDTTDGTTLGAMTWREIPYEGLWQIDGLGFIISDLNNVLGGSEVPAALPSAIPYMAREVCGVDGVPLNMYVEGLLEVRSDTDLTRVTLAAETNPVIVSSSEVVQFTPSDLGSTAKLYVRPLRGDASSRTVLDLIVKSAPNPPAGAVPAPKILLFGDSIGNHQGPMLLNQFLTQWGYAPTFIGTYPSSIAESDGWNRLGLVCEAKQSWSGNQFSYEDATRTPIAEGGEAAYLSSTKPYMSGFNPFLRLATGADPAAFVKNGYIFDAAFYQQRFGLESPTIIINALNTNDFRDQSAADIYNTVYENDILFHTQFRAAWPNAKIIRCMPGTARNSGIGADNRDTMWTSHYIPAIRAMMDARAFLNDPNITIASSWAFYSQEAGYVLEAGVTDLTTGAVTAKLGDVLHPQGSTRRQYYQYLAGHVACAAVDLI